MHLSPPVGLENHVLATEAVAPANPKPKRTWVSRTPSRDEVLPTLRILLREDRIDEAKDIIEFAYTRYPHAFR